ncbi:MAG: DUF1249 domain-containing protein [Candidatus Obscuribacterales bacterium]|nr:DUF1249 domain-containing protein [Steroidobacteraceae bacterium]
MIDVLQSDSLLPVSWRGAPRTFVSLMTLYESNYIRLRQLVDDLGRMRDEYVSIPKDDCPLRLTVEERGRYTTTFTLTYLFGMDGSGNGDEAATDPDLQVRVYHDARLAEALRSASAHRHHLLTALRQRVSGELDDRWRRNMMLNKWLDYCESRGHRFDSAGRSR